MPLTMVQAGESGEISSIHADLKMSQHLNEMGFVPGERVSVIGANDSGLILDVKGVRMALNRGLAQKICVKC